MIPDINKFKQDEEKEITRSIPNCIFKDEERYMHQNEKAFMIEEIPLDSKSTISINKNPITLNQDNQIEEESNNNNNDSNIPKGRDKDRDEAKDKEKDKGESSLTKKKKRNYLLNQGIPGTEIEVKINCDDGNENLKRYFLKTVCILSIYYLLINRNYPYTIPLLLNLYQNSYAINRIFQLIA